MGDSLIKQPDNRAKHAIFSLRICTARSSSGENNNSRTTTTTKKEEPFVAQLQLWKVNQEIIGVQERQIKSRTIHYKRSFPLRQNLTEARRVKKSSLWMTKH